MAKSSKPSKRDLATLERQATLRNQSFTERKYIDERAPSAAMILALGRLFRPDIKLSRSLGSPIEPRISGVQFAALEARGWIYYLWSNLEDQLYPTLSQIGRNRVEGFILAGQLVKP